MRTTPGATARFCRIPTGSGTFNAIRYRGYYYDVETGLYYLMSRYYDPATGRFLSPDDLSYLDPETINGLNLFAYCGNNPVMNTDPEGHAWWQWLVAAVVVVAAVAISVATAGVAAGWAGNDGLLRFGVNNLKIAGNSLLKMLRVKELTIKSLGAFGKYLSPILKSTVMTVVGGISKIFN